MATVPKGGEQNTKALAASKPGVSYLTLGWRVEGEAHAPTYWLKSGASPGKQGDEHLYRVPADWAANHTVIIAQSGSGKSTFLGRLLEELLLNTRARCLVLDPNADFRIVNQIEGESLWTEAGYDQKKGGKLPHEASRADFERLWASIPKRIKTNQANPSAPYYPLRIWWPSLDVASIAEEIGPMPRGEFYYCHTLMADLANLLQVKAALFDTSYDLTEQFQRILRRARAMPKDDFEETTREEFNFNEWKEETIRKLEKQADKKSSEVAEINEAAEMSLWNLGIQLFGGIVQAVKKQYRAAQSLEGLEQRITEFIARAQKVGEYVSPSVERFYLGMIREGIRHGIVKTEVTADGGSRQHPRLDVVDLPSLNDKGARLLATAAIVAGAWDRARKAWSDSLEAPKDKDERVPTYIVVDEAHNLMPARARGRAEASLRDQFRTLAAEGRKYGLFLLLVSQRPDKLDPLILSECENKAVMRLASLSVVEQTKKLLGLEDHHEALIECVKFKIGRTLLFGRWADWHPTVFYSAARRTVEGGRDLRSEHWAVRPGGP